MKKREKIPTAADIILGNQELSSIIRKLVEELTKNNINKTKFLKIMSQAWDDMAPEKDTTKPKIGLEPSKEELDFIAKPGATDSSGFLFIIYEQLYFNST